MSRSTSKRTPPGASSSNDPQAAATPAEGTIRLPTGMRDYLPKAAAHRRQVAQSFLQRFECWGYARVITPLFEYADVLARGSDTPTIRFVEPITGEVLALRPDMTPQMARLVATRLAGVPGPIRLCYEGSVLRLQHRGGQRELLQAGIELVDAKKPDGDAEAMALAAEALLSVGMTDLTLDVGHTGFLRSALSGLPDAVRHAIARKDAAHVTALCKESGMDASRQKLISALPRLYGEPKVVLANARKLCDAALGALLDEVEAALDAWQAFGISARVTLDLGELRGFDYYTGVRFAGFARGHGDALMVGGRYDDLCERYGRKAQATGFAIDVEAVADALELRSAPGEGVAAGRGTLVVGAMPLSARVATALRKRGERAATHPEGNEASTLVNYATRAGFGRVLRVSARGAEVITANGACNALSQAEWKELADV